MPIIGAHVSAAGGYRNAIKKAQEIGAECIQIFGASPRSYSTKMPAEENIKEYEVALEKSGIKHIFLHAPYLINLASDNADILKKSIRSLSDHLIIAERLNARGLIFHIGSGKKQPRKQAINRTIAGIKKTLKMVPGRTKLIMENTAGGGNSIGNTEAEIGDIFKKINNKRVGVCIDTAHAFEAGMILEYTPAKIKKFLDELDKYIGFNNIKAFHINDSLTTAGSHHDRHENIGEGCIGIKGFENLGKDKRMKNMPWILEVPGFDGTGPDKQNIEILKRICK